jgi:hypothetical protein
MANEFIIKNGFHSKGDSEITGSLGVTGDITSNSFFKIGGTSAQFLKADGSVDASTYLTSVGTINLTSGVTGILPVPNGGTGLDTLTSGYIPYGNGTSAFSNNSALLFNESIKQLRITGDSTNDPLRLSNVQTNSDETKTALILASSDGGVQKATLGSFATISSLAFSSLTGKPTTVAGYGITDAATATSTTTFTNKSGNISQWTNNSGYLTAFTVQEDGSNVETGTKKLNFTGDGVSTTTDGVDKVTITIPGGGGGGVFSQVGSTTQFSTTSSLLVTGSNSEASASLEVHGSGSNIFKVEGSIGTLFSVDDGLDDVIFAANNVSGTPVIEANADNTVKLGKLGGFGIVISGSTPAPSDTSANIIITGSIQHNGSYGLGVAASATIGRFDASNDVVAFSTSDERLKKYVKNIPNALDKVSQINGVTFQWKKTDDETKQNVHSFEGKDVGVIAQEIEKVLPEVVITRDNGYKAVKYEKIIPLLIESVKELKAEIEELKKSK